MTLALVATTILIGAARPQPGQVAPEFTLESSTGRQVSLKEFRGRSVVLAFFPKAFTSG
jgi:thioredoxin-dependent peroxiredoxin